MVKAQKAFQAATRMVNTIDEMLDRIINNMGLVGR
jgi:flagellar hook-associated protein 1 FlgK